ncbi:MAG: hypothetical protein EBR82_02630 [Caulobacteraceae bacterium]|nr:hypothetical protein [Caulobacteraceae bacterium]
MDGRGAAELTATRTRGRSMKRWWWVAVLALLAAVVGAAACATFLIPSERLFDLQTRLTMAPSPDKSELSYASTGRVPDPVLDSRARDFPYVNVDLLVRPDGKVANARLRDTEPALPADLKAKVLQRALEFQFSYPAETNGRRGWTRAYEEVTVRLPEIRPTRHVPFPSWTGKTVAITLERTSCFGTCPAYVVVIHGDGAVDYCGRAFVKATGWRRSRIEPAKVEALLRQFRDADFFSLNDSYVAPITDNPSYVVGVEVGSQRKKVEDYVGDQAGMPASVTRLEDAIDAAANTAQWIGPRGGYDEMSYADAADCSVPKA